MRDTWDAKKSRQNKAKHGIGFEEAVRIFEKPTIEWIDERFDYGEERIVAYGRVGGRIVVVIYTERADERRIISARKAERHEAQEYWQAVSI